MKLPAFSLLVFLAGACAVHGAEPTAIDAKLKESFAVAHQERVAVIGIGDSNQRFGGHGYSAFMAEALNQQFGCYGSELVLYHQWQEKDQPLHPAAPQELASKAFSYWYLSPGEREAVSWKHGAVSIPADHPLGVQGNLRFHLTYGAFQCEGGTFRPAIRKDLPPWNLLKSEASPLHSGTDTPSHLVQYTMDLPADPERNYPVRFMVSPLPEQVTGEFLAASASCENTDKQSGLSYSTLYAQGGQSLYDMLTTFRQTGSERLEEFFTRIRESLNGRKTCVIMITSGLNDRHEPEKSAGPSSSSPEGYSDNLEGIVQTLQTAWVNAGGSPQTIHFAFMPSHALADPDDTQLIAYRAAARNLAARLPNASMIDLSILVPYQEMAANHYYDKGTSTNPHLDKSGYKAIATALASKLTE
ncbi:MAG: hypothetical protein ACFUZC_08485 [Chthoniobacteraceae bacterium]